MRTSGNTSGVNPLPSLIWASASDSAARRCRDAGRKAWNRADADEAAETFHRLVAACYQRPWDLPDAIDPRVRFQVARGLQDQGIFTLDSDFRVINEILDELVPPPRELWPHVAEGR